MRLLLLQIGSEAQVSGWDLIWGGTLTTQVVLMVLAAFSVVSWVIIFWKWIVLGRVRRQGDRFLAAVERSQRMEDAYKAVLALPDSPYNRVFRQGVNFFSELRPGALKAGTGGEVLTRGQLEVLMLIMEKEESEERDQLSVGLTWLAVIGVVSPLLGLLGTVIGIMNSFIGIVASGSTNIAAVAPGIAEALIATAFGLGAAIPAYIAHNYFVARIDLVAGELEGCSAEFIGSLAREGRI